ncbi:hypothetical protein NDU88_010773 [Pleurodeles waltl]|uniref:Uncharacterized protein n=1 Tax=Pleurodeles waltl TaxID=8319 RepID=A0AAV7S0L5_PLEWA|nr:hypothetical protein NDU88_010773 [Pleurodeles waltl]
MGMCRKCALPASGKPQARISLLGRGSRVSVRCLVRSRQLLLLPQGEEASAPTGLQFRCTIFARLRGDSSYVDGLIRNISLHFTLFD